MKNRHWIILLAGILILALVFSLPVIFPSGDAALAQIYSNGQLVRTVLLSVDQEFTLDTEGGSNTVTVRGGKIAVTQATCPDHYCMDRGFCSGGTPIVCLPNALVIQFTGEQEIDGLIG